MAEIPIQRKESRNWVPLILGALVLLALLAYCFTRPTPVAPVAAGADSTRATGGSADTARPAAAAGSAAGTAAGAAAPNGDAVAQFVQFVQQRDTTQETEGQHAYTAEGVRRLAAALDQVAGQGGSQTISVYADSMRSAIDRLQRSSPKDVHADDAKAAFSAAVSAMTTIDKAQGRTRDIAPMRAIYSQLSATRPLLAQLGTVDRFFKAASEALQTMNVPGAASGAAAGGAGAAPTSR